MRYVYVLLTDTGTCFSRCIKQYTKEPMNHASLALDSGLRELYSFGRKHPLNAFSGGFVREKAWDGLIRSRNRPTPCAVYRRPVTADQYRALRGRLLDMEKHKLDYSYNLLGLFALMLGFDWPRTTSFFCSQFVEVMFQEIGIPLSGKPASLTKPGDFEQAPALELLFKGDLRDYAGEPASHEARSALRETAAHKSGVAIHFAGFHSHTLPSDDLHR